MTAPASAGLAFVTESRREHPTGCPLAVGRMLPDGCGGSAGQGSVLTNDVVARL